MPYFVNLHQRLAGLAMISAVLAFIAPSAIADMVQVRDVIKSHYEQNLTKLQLDAGEEAALKRLLSINIAERMDLFERHGFTPGQKPSFRKMLSMRGDMRELNRAQKARLAQVLSAEQMAVWEEIEDNLREKIRAAMSQQ